MLFLGKIVFGEEIIEEDTFVLPLKANMVSKKMSGNTKIHLISSSLSETKAEGYVASYKQTGINRIKKCKGV